jgi:hypothetical protein
VKSKSYRRTRIRKQRREKEMNPLYDLHVRDDADTLRQMLNATKMREVIDNISDFKRMLFNDKHEINHKLDKAVDEREENNKLTFETSQELYEFVDDFLVEVTMALGEIMFEVLED